MLVVPESTNCLDSVNKCVNSGHNSGYFIKNSSAPASTKSLMHSLSFITPAPSKFLPVEASISADMVFVTVSVENISDGTAIEVENANIIIDRVA